MDAVGNDAEGGGNDDSKLLLLTAVSIYTIGLVVVQDPGQGFRDPRKGHSVACSVVKSIKCLVSGFQHGTHNYLEDNQMEEEEAMEATRRTWQVEALAHHDHDHVVIGYDRYDPMAVMA